MQTITKHINYFYHLILISIFLTTNSFGQEGRLNRTELFSIPTSKLNNAAAGYSFKIAVDNDENIAFNACSVPFVFIYTKNGEQIDSIKLPFTTCIRNIEYDEEDNLLIMDNDEFNIYKYNKQKKQLEIFP